MTTCATALFFGRDFWLDRSRWLPAWIACCLCLSAACADDLRVWTDSGGKHKVKARYISVQDDMVTLEREDGEQVEIELKRLSAADREFVAERQGSPFKPSKLDPFKPKSKKKTAIEGGMADAPVRMPDWSEARVVDLTPRNSNWSFAPAARQLNETSARPRPIALPAFVDFFEKLVGMAVNAGGKRAVLGYKLKRPGQRSDETTRILLVDLERGKVLGAGTTDGAFAPLDLDDAGKRVLVRRDEFGHGNQDRLEIWKLSSAGIEAECRWLPYGDEKGVDRDVRWAAFVGADRIASCSSGGKIAVWENNSAKPIYWLQAKNGCAPGLSSDRKHLAFATNKEIAVLDVDAGEILANQGAADMAWPTFAFDRSGKRLACLSHTKLHVWEMADGRLYREIDLAGLHADGKLAWASDHHVVVGSRFLIDLENQVRLWDFQNAEAARAAGDCIWFEFSEGNRRPGGLVPAKLPTPDIERSLSSAMQDPRFFVMRPGTTVRVNVDGVQDVNERDKIRAALTAKLQANDIKVGESDVELLATTEVGPEREIAYHTFGSFGTKTYKVRPGISRVRFVVQGKDAWRNEAVNVPFFVQLKKNETMEQHLRDCERPNHAFFEGVQLPKLLTRPTGKPTLGSSRIGLASLGR